MCRIKIQLFVVICAVLVFALVAATPTRAQQASTAQTHSF